MDLLIQKISFLTNKKTVWVTSLIFLFIISVTVFQDFVDSVKNDHAFYLSESLLFKTIWILFFPILFVLHKTLKNRVVEKPFQILLAVVLPSLVHLILLPSIVSGISHLFFSSPYGYYKILTFTLSNDLYKLFLIYGAFVFYIKGIGFKNFRREKETLGAALSSLKSIAIGNGINHSIIKASDILYIKAATPYVEIHAGNKKYLQTDTLKSIHGKLGKDNFLRVHKSTIVNLEKVVSYRSRLNGDYDLILENGNEIRLSRNFLSNFRTRFETGPQDKT